MNARAASESPLAGRNDLAANRRTLFLAGFLVLFLELACIRWFAAYVIFLQFFTNIILIASFLGMSVGCLCATKRSDWLGRFPWLSLVAVGSAVGLNLLYHHWRGIAIDVGGQGRSPQTVFFGTEFRDVDLAEFVIPIELLACYFFGLVTLLFVGLGQVLGRCFERDPHRVLAYTCNIGGSLAGIGGFAVVSFVHAPPAVWFGIGFLGVAYLLWQAAALRVSHVVYLGASIVLIIAAGLPWSNQLRSIWSPYYWITYRAPSREIIVNNISHQIMTPVDATSDVDRERMAVYATIHELQRNSPHPPFQDVLVIGAGSGNDVAHALAGGARSVDAVEIDPVIQRLGARYHPDQPYADPRVRVHLTDGRNFLRRTTRKYDLVVYALVDSLIQHSGYGNIRLESFLFTEQSLRDVKRVLKPGGVFVSYNQFRQGWIVQRMVRMVEEVFGQKPFVVTLPYVDRISDARFEGLTIIAAGDTAELAQAFHARVPPIAVEANPRLAPATDDWPFLYLRAPGVPWLYTRGVLLLGAVGLGVLYWLAPGHRVGLGGRMFFLGAAFLLLETKAVVHLALVFGSTWVVNSLVFAAILVMILAANLYVIAVRQVSLRRHYGALFATLAINAVVPLDVFLAGNVLWKYVAPCVLVMVPLFFAGVIFACTFRASTRPDRDFGANIAGAVLGGFSEYLSMLVGFRYLLFVAMGFYALSAVFHRGGSSSQASSRRRSLRGIAALLQAPRAHDADHQ